MELRDQILDHGNDYDGIKEYDNPLPLWFLYMFYVCVVFSFLYCGYYFGKTSSLIRLTGNGQNLAVSGAILQAELITIQKADAAAPFTAPSGEALMAALKNPRHISRGAALFKANCVACHGEQAQGIVGPNLVDVFWIHGGKPEAVVHSIANGWMENGMPAWQPNLGVERVHWLAAYVMSIRGKQVQNPKAPQGDKFE